MPHENKYSELTFRLMVESAPNALILVNKEGRIAFVNGEAERLFGYSTNELPGQQIGIIIPIKYRQKHPADLHSFFSAPQARAMGAGRELFALKKDGTEFPVEIGLNPVVTVEGTLVLAAVIDITERKRAEQQQSLFELIVNSSNDAIISKNLQGIVTSWNHTAEKVFGYTAEEIVGKDISALIPAHLVNEEEEILSKIRNGEVIEHYETERTRKDGQTIFVSLTISPVRDSLGRVIGASKISHDITARKKAEKAILRANRLYAFLSAINQSIVHLKDEQTLFNEVCRIAVDVGKFEFAWIGFVDEANRKIRLVAEKSAAKTDFEVFGSLNYPENNPRFFSLKNGDYYIINDYDSEPMDSLRRQYITSRGFKSSISLPIKKPGDIAFVLNLFTFIPGFFNSEELALLDEVAGDISFALDVFEKEKHRKQLEDEMIHRERRLKEAQSIAHFGNWELDYSTGIGIWSEETCRIYGLSIEDSIQTYESWVSFLHPDDKDYVMNVLKEGAATLSDSAFHHRITRKDGTIRHIFSHAQFYFDKAGQPIGMHGVTHDVTDTHEAENALAQSEANLRLMMDIIPHAIFSKDFNGRYLFVNKIFAGIYGLTPEQMSGKTIDEIIPVKSEARGFVNQDREIILSGKTKVITEQPFTDHMGVKRLFQATKVPYTVAGTNEKAVLGITMDITEQKKAEKEREKMIADIVQRNKNLEQFSYIVSHNLRVPVANIIGIADVIRLLGRVEGDEKVLMDNLCVSVEKLDSVIRDLNQILQVRNQGSNKKEWVRFSKLLADIELSIEFMIKKEDVQITSDFSAVDEILTVKSYLHSIFFNLISNSIKYRQPEIKPVLEIVSALKNEKIQITFKDNGLGIDTGNPNNKVFGLYKRFHTHVEGKGMGLFMVKTQVESLGGEITLKSEVNKGCKFTLEFDTKEI